MAADERSSYLVGGGLALLLAPLLAGAYAMEAFGEGGAGWHPSPGRVLLWAGTALLGVYLVAASGFWLVDTPRWLAWMRRLAPVPFLALLGGFMFAVRMIPYKSRLAPELGRVYFAGSTDPFYHFRAMIGIVRNFPFGPRWDPWTFYPQGTGTGQFGTLFDWIPSAWVVLRHGREATEYDIAVALSIYTVIIGSIIIVPFYFLAKRLLGGTVPAVVSSITLALMGGGFLAWGIATAGDHHGAEALGSVVSVFGVFWAAERAHQFRAGLVRKAGWRAWRPVVIAGVVGGAAMAVNMLMWPPALLFAAILTAWLTVCILLENAKEEGDARGLTAGGAIAMAVAGLIMATVIDTTFLGEFNTYGLLHVVSCLFAAVWLVGVHAASRLEARLGWSPWTVPGAVAGAAVFVFFFVRLFLKEAFAGIQWGLSWISGIGTPRTTATIGEARETAFFCTNKVLREGQSCLGDDFGLLPAITFLVLLAVIVVAVWKRDRADILLALWAFVVFRAVDTQARFGYYLAVVMALLLGWLAARLALAAGVFSVPTTAVKRGGKRGNRKPESASRGVGMPVQMGAAALVLLLVLPGNVFASDRSYPSWEIAQAYAGRSGEMALWLDGLDWMRENTPEAGVDLVELYKKPAPGARFDYPDETYGVLSWWDYGHWIETWAKRPPVANPFQQAAPFASTWFTERSPALAEAQLSAWEGDAPPVRYVWIDAAMATGKYGAITVWANSQNGSRPQWAALDCTRQSSAGYEGTENYLFNTQQATRAQVSVNGQQVEVPMIGPGYAETMMGRLYDGDGNGLSHYRLVYEHPDYIAVGSISCDDGRARCFHESIPSNACPINVNVGHIDAWLNDPSTAVPLGRDAHAYDIDLESSLKLFERVEGARIQGQVAPGAEVVARVLLRAEQANGAARPFEHTETTIAGPDGRFEIVWPYPTTDLLAPADGGTNAMVKPQSRVVVRAGALAVETDVTERAVLDGLSVPVSFV